MSYGLTVLGSVNLDLIVQVQDLPKAGETVTGGAYTALPGGKGANVAVAAKRLGAETEIMAAVGDDCRASADQFRKRRCLFGRRPLAGRAYRSGLYHGLG